MEMIRNNRIGHVISDVMIKIFDIIVDGKITIAKKKKKTKKETYLNTINKIRNPAFICYRSFYSRLSCRNDEQ